MNNVVHFELPYDDKDRALSFYREVFGWEVNDIPEMKYTIVHTMETDEENMPKKSGAINGGMYKREGKLSEHPVIVVNVDDLEAHLAKIEASGGSITLPKNQVGDMGLYAQVKDTEGNVVGVWQNLKKE